MRPVDLGMPYKWEAMAVGYLCESDLNSDRLRSNQ
jgi:hypothetical protein